MKAAYQCYECGCIFDYLTDENGSVTDENGSSIESVLDDKPELLIDTHCQKCLLNGEPGLTRVMNPRWPRKMRKVTPKEQIEHIQMIRYFDLNELKKKASNEECIAYNKLIPKLYQDREIRQAAQAVEMAARRKAIKERNELKRLQRDPFYYPFAHNLAPHAILIPTDEILYEWITKNAK